MFELPVGSRRVYIDYMTCHTYHQVDYPRADDVDQPNLILTFIYQRSNLLNQGFKIANIAENNFYLKFTKSLVQKRWSSDSCGLDWIYKLEWIGLCYKQHLIVGQRAKPSYSHHSQCQKYYSANKKILFVDLHFQQRTILAT